MWWLVLSCNNTDFFVIFVFIRITSMKHLTIIILLFLFTSTIFASTKIDSLLHELDVKIAYSNEYEKGKKNRIANIKSELVQNGIDDEERFRINEMLYKEYEFYISDSARFYIDRCIEIAQNNDDGVRLANSMIKKSNLLAKAGLYPEAIELLRSVNTSYLNSEDLARYYLVYEHTYLYHAEYARGDEVVGKYLDLRNNYRDSALMLLPVNEYLYTITKTSQLIEEGLFEEAEDKLLNLLPRVGSGTRDFAVLTSILAFLYECMGDSEMRKVYLIKSALSDIQAVVKENNSLRTLAEILYEEGQIARADLYVKTSMEDANFYNARLRNLQASRLLPIIDSAYQLEKEVQQKKLKLLLIIISVLSAFLLAAVIYAVAQVRKLAKSRKEIMKFNNELNVLNNELTRANREQQRSNNLLYEANIIKEEYIGRFLGLCSTYIDKLEAYRRMLNKKATSGKIEELYTTLKSTRLVEDELNEFYKNFDHSFLKIFPDFVDEFNALLPEEEKITPKQDEHLTTKLRIYALIRIGINDSAEIASLLRYSITTIYTYRSKLKKSSLHKDDFEDKIMEIGAFRSL